MFVITADQVDSRHGHDLVQPTLGAIAGTGRFVLPPERTAGDELQALTADPMVAVDVLVLLTRSGSWSIGLGVGDVDTPLPDATRAATGTAFYRARDAVEEAKSRPERLAVAIEPGRHRTTADVEPLLAQTLRHLARRSAEDWALADLLASGRTQHEVAEELGITQQAVSKRAVRAGLRSDDGLRHALARLLDDADTPETQTRTDDR